jgi:hypothetical protein
VLCVVSVMIMIVVGTDMGVHDHFRCPILGIYLSNTIKNLDLTFYITSQIY